MRLIVTYLIIVASAFAAKSAHPRMLIASSCGGSPTLPCLGAVDGTTSGSLRWKAVQTESDWEHFRSDVDGTMTNIGASNSTFCASIPTAYANSGPDYQIGITLMGMILENMTVGTDATYNAETYIVCAEQLMDAYHAGAVTASCPGQITTGPNYFSGGSGGTPGTQTVTFTNGGGSGATGTITVNSSGVPTGAVTMTSVGDGYTSVPTQGTVATVTGTITFSGGTKTGIYADCNSCSHPPTSNGNIYRQQWKRYALFFDWVMGSNWPPNSTEITNYVNDLHMSGEASITKLCYAESPEKTAYNGGVGPAQNVYGWNTSYMIGVATYGNNPTDTSTGCVHGETQCNDETTAALNDFYNNDVLWWTQNTLGVNGQSQCQPSVPQTQAAGAYGGGKGCGVGGLYADGMEYWPQAMQYTLEAIEASVNADSPSVNLWSALPSYFPTDQVNGLLYSTAPTRSHRQGSTFYSYELDNQGDQQNGTGSSALWYFDPGLGWAAEILASHIGNSTYGNYARWWVDNIPLNSNTGGPSYGSDPGHSTWSTSWAYFLYLDDTGLPRTDYRTAVSSGYHAAGEDEMISFATPKGTSCPGVTICTASTWAIFANREMGTNHAHNDAGEFTIWRKSAWLALGPIGYGFPVVLSGEGHNVAVWQNSTQAAGGYFQGPDVFPKANGGNYMGGFNVANETNSSYVYSWVDTTYANHSQWNSNPVKTQREYLQFFPDRWVILDRGVMSSASLGAFQVNTPRKVAPSTTGNVTTMTATGNNDGNGGPDQVLFITALVPSGQTIQTANWNGGISQIKYINASPSTFGSSGFPSSGTYSYLGSAGSTTGLMSWDRYRGITPSTSTAFIMLNGLEGADSGATATASEALTATGLTCDHWKDSTQDQIACFSSDTGGALLTLPVATYTYTPSATASLHVIADLPSSTAVNVAVTRGATNSYTINNSGGSGTAMTTSPAGVLAFADSGSALTQTNGSGSPSCMITSPGPGALTSGTIGVAYNGGSGVSFTTSGCAAPSFSISVGALPGGITQNSSSGLLSGTPTLPGGTFNFTVLVTDANCSGSCSDAYSIFVAAPSSPGGTAISGSVTLNGNATTH